MAICLFALWRQLDLHRKQTIKIIRMSYANLNLEKRMKSKSKRNWLILSLMSVLLASSVLLHGQQKWDPLDWDDDLILNADELSDGTNMYDPMSSAVSHARALVLGQLKSAAASACLMRAFQFCDSFTMEFCIHLLLIRLVPVTAPSSIFRWRDELVCEDCGKRDYG